MKLSAHVLCELEDILENRDRRFLVLYSGGLDGSYFLQWAREQQLDVTALHVAFTDGDADRARRNAALLNTPILVEDGTEKFANDFVAAAIHTNAWYQGLFPVGSTLSRPLMAEIAARVAEDLDCDVVVHTSTFMQNTAMRLGLALLSLAPNLGVAAPFTRTTLTRGEKMAALDGLPLDLGANARYSVDANPWARVIENDTLEDPELILPDAGVFLWTRELEDTPATADDLSIEFDEGLPYAVDGVAMPLAEIVGALNERGGAQGVGRHVGLESLNPSGLKNHEIREAPAATLITLAHRTLESAVFTDDELTMKSLIDTKATALAVGGDWFGVLATALRSASTQLDEASTGRVRIRMHRGQATVVAKSSPNGLYYHRFGDQFAEMMRRTSVAEQLSLASLPNRLRVTNHQSSGATQLGPSLMGAVSQ